MKDELNVAKKKIIFQNEEKGKRAAELAVANIKLIFEKKEKRKRAAELIVANKELIFQNGEKEMRAVELIAANKELAFQNEEKEKRAAELAVANKHLVLQNAEKEKRTAELKLVIKELAFQIEGRKKTEKKLIYVNRLYGFISQISQAIIHAENERILFDEACRIAIEVGKFKAAWVGILDTENKTITVVEECGLEHTPLQQFSNLSYEDKGLQDYVLRTGNYYVCNNIQHNLELDSWKQLAAEKDFNSCMVLPIKKSGIVAGTFNLYASEAAFFREEEILLLQEATADISFALDVFEKDKLKMQADLKLKESEIQYRNLIQDLPVAIYTTDAEGIVQLYNTGAMELWGQEPVNGKNPCDGLLKIYSADNSLLPWHRSPMAIALSEGRNVYSEEIIIERADGTKRYAVPYPTPRFDGSGELTGAINVLIDITERKIIEVALQKSEGNLKALFENTSEAFILSDVNGNVKSFNTRAKRLLSLNTGEEIEIGKSIFDLHKSKKGEYKKIISKVLSGETIQFDHCYKRKSGETTWFSWTKTPVYKENRIDGICITASDITERKATELRLHTEELRLRDYFENAPEAIMILDANSGGTFIRANNNAIKLLKCTSKGILNKTPADISPVYQPDGSRSVDKANKYINAAMAGEKPVFDWIIIDANGKEFLCEVHLARLSASNEHHILASFHDITASMRAAELLQRSESNLKAIIENTEATIYSLDKNFRYITFNKRLRDNLKEIYGLDIKPGDNVFDFLEKLNPAEARDWEKIYSRALTGEPVKFEKEFNFNNIYSCFSFSIHPIWENKQVIGLSCFTLDISKQKQTSNALKQSEFQFRQIVETAQEGIWLIDEANITTFVNEKMCEILGYSEAEMLGKENYYFMDEPGKLIALESLQERKKGKGGNSSMRLITKSGKLVWVNISANPIFDDHSNYKGTLGMVSDITDNRKLENLLDKTNDLARIGSWEIDTHNNTVYWSPITKQIHGVESDFMPDVEKVLGSFKADSARGAISHAILEAMEKGIPFDLELQLVTPNYAERWVRINGEAEFMNGKCILVYGTCQDIDKRKKAEIEVLKVYEEKNTILESIGDAFFAVDKNWMVTYWNSQAEKMLHISKSEIIGRNLWEVFADSIESESYKKYHQAVETKQLIRFNDYYESLDKWFEINAYPSNNGLSVFFKDITQKRKYEEERVKITADLIQRNKDLEQFSYIISHNLRAPVANIIGLSNTLQKKNLRDDLKKPVMTGLSTSASKLDEVIKDLNNILNIRRGIGENKKIVSFTELTKDIELSIESMIENAHGIIRCDFSEVDEMDTIKSYLHSIFYNLISNSLKYRQPNLQLLIEIRSQLLEGKIILFFKDNGLGIDMKKLGNQVFGLYKRFHTDRAEGKGIGLYMVQTQAESMGGKVSITSQVHVGTEVKIEFEIKQS